MQTDVGVCVFWVVWEHNNCDWFQTFSDTLAKAYTKEGMGNSQRDNFAGVCEEAPKEEKCEGI